MGSSPSVATLSSPLLNAKLSVTSRKNFAMLPPTSNKRWPPPPPAAPSKRAIPLPRDHVPTLLHRYGIIRCSRNHLQLHHEVRHRYPQGLVRQQRLVRRNHHVPRYR